MRRPLCARVWFTRPQWYWYGWKTLLPFFRGGDEFDWHCWEIGWTITGRVTFAIRPCPETGRCALDDEERAERGPLARWPIDAYGHDHSQVA